MPQLTTFEAIDISAQINHDWKYNGGVLAGNGRVYFVPRNADNIGVLAPSSTSRGRQRKAFGERPMANASLPSVGRAAGTVASLLPSGMLTELALHERKPS